MQTPTTKQVCAWTLLIAGVAIMTGCPPTTPTPTITPQNLNPPTQPYSCPNVVNLADANSAATIFYSVNGTPVPGQAGTFQYNGNNGTGPFQVNGPGLQTLTAMAQSPGLNQSPNQTATFSCAPAPAPPTFTPMPVAGESCPLTVTVNAASPTILVSNNGQPPSITNNVFAGSPPTTETITKQETLEAIACSANQLCSDPPTKATYTCAPPPPPATFDTIDIGIQTGNDNADQNLEITAFMSGPKAFEGTLCLKPSNDSSVPSGSAGVGQWDSCANGASSAPQWRKGQGWNLTAAAGIGAIKLPHPITPQQLASSTMQIAAVQSGSGNFCSTCSNWDLQDMMVTFTDSTGRLAPTTLSMGSFITSGWNDDNCIARLKAPPNATTVQFGLGNSSVSNPPIMFLTYVDGTSAESGAVATCKDNGDGGTPP